MAKLASKVYGEALFQVAVEENRIDEMMEEIRTVREALEENRGAVRADGASEDHQGGEGTSDGELL